ncbi:MAG: Phospho-N-acetylmuramoyl-pentapeptide-transferase [Candidatus Daviesbacteria bacterium GW2011_GWA1_41_61]|uniref:Phospho-N-acetylmuramoyl-pentapeptide-transferase n=1 Tax=Candidatus Daviesbacteria bacterium GW2011_GWA2_40_9 TaxID=1618424 RepID=A0A0G0U1J3_9BACT|nr:MAG: Phospho-N-acetylmuramoyl-pentapeptide-transferase [Candidatus Daviesbacteria bacterium GW2011_GWC1_40_9]KKR82979.1 MAG: Phospho-N-acetylmuramoyl-pentapeptide-transferase [Candidatus Daviesbacteria bacterium GW2011_GWA2_40_9]KKR92905.1 MAG: Phospho-N-acetylmuramoyl-pentapeptide-transferase [Candidatus Daviesbacteria bacterium GW2011_GWB1_41_15]KKS15449.1 MAG: Phospho-N-acetylmuramoyl-pentapeptide-transferase [Candidatus Daviesbacteria bacterium GW2011_GWA1_41_61]
MIELLGLIIISFFVTSFLLVPFIDLLFYLKRRDKKSAILAHDVNTPIHNQLLAGKDIDTPIGGGILLIPIVVVLSLLAAFVTRQGPSEDIYVLVFTILTFGSIGLLDDIRKIFISFSGKYSGIRGRYLFLLQLLFAVLVALLLYFVVGLNNIFVPVIGNIVLGWWYIPLAVFAIVSFANAYNISDGLDGLSTGLLTICLFAFLVLASSVLNQNLAIFTGVWIGVLIAYLYFNIYPARVYLGDAGAFGFGATLAVIGLLTGKIFGLAVIGGVYVVIIFSSLLQIFSKKFLKRKLLPVAPIHMYFKYIGWEEPKIVVRFWLAGAVLAIFGLWLALISQ